ncbi:MAG TPA: hypothetical protein PLM53_05820 [Spirochaetota bacterium]|nr:hypothetical protein [Spirochaetota bacterium]HQF08038.1 hypothetical protein [Spirochaetota bacterium]HQH96598.1 hypothetical protein [Spirochaetota bacterium]
MKSSGKGAVMRFLPITALVLCVMAVVHAPAETDRFKADDDRKHAGDRGARADEETSGFGNKALKEAEEERSYRRDNVVITVRKLYAEDRYYWNFEVTVVNQNDIKKTVEGRICLYNMYIQPRECGSEECGVNMAVQPKSVQTRKFRCRGKMDMNSWAFLIVTVHSY